MTARAVRLVVSGKVQGVFYRGWTVETATKLALDGWVRNRADGTVEVFLYGRSEQIDQMTLKAKSGPKMAMVEHVEIIPAIGVTPKGFKQKPTVDMRDSRN
jgi:acylphosphatase